ncbi:type VII secretion target [Plantactinospora sonchi]|uniref:Type VII secretion target n=1 Tax=Plantactinospora sonchi TaxID=1544735 RepID=A0ABU7RNX4_9ACTN
MAAAPGMIHGDTELLRQVADRLDPAAVVAARTAAAEVAGSARDCGDTLPGCQRYNAAVREVTDRIIAFCAEVEQGITAYASVARDSASGYLGGDDTGRTAIQGAVPASPTTQR